MKKKLIELSPLIVVALVAIYLFSVAFHNISSEPEKVLITSSTLKETVNTANLATAKYIQNGICKAYIPDTFDGYVMYYATVRLNVDFAKIDFIIDDVAKTVTPIIPEFSFDVELDKERMYFYPNDDDLTAKEVLYLCEIDAVEKANDNSELKRVAHENLIKTIEALVLPLLGTDGYTFVTN